MLMKMLITTEVTIDCVGAGAGVCLCRRYDNVRWWYCGHVVVTYTHYIIHREYS